MDHCLCCEGHAGAYGPRSHAEQDSDISQEEAEVSLSTKERWAAGHSRSKEVSCKGRSWPLHFLYLAMRGAAWCLHIDWVLDNLTFFKCFDPPVNLGSAPMKLKNQVAFPRWSRSQCFVPFLCTFGCETTFSVFHLVRVIFVYVCFVCLFVCSLGAWTHRIRDCICKSSGQPGVTT